MKLSLTSLEISYKSKCDQNLQLGTILHKKLKILIFNFFNFNFFSNCPFGRGFPTIYTAQKLNFSI